MTSLVGPLCFMVAALAVLLGAAGLLPWPFVFRVVVGSAALLLVYAGGAGVLLTVKRRRTEALRRLADAKTKTAAHSVYLLAVAEGLIREGDLVRFDPETRKVKRVESIPNTPEGHIQ